MTGLPDLFAIAGRQAMVTGASRGLGRSIALALAEAGTTLVLTARTAAALAETAKLAREAGAEVTCLACDQSDPEAVEEAFEGLAPLDILVNNAGIEDVRASAEVDAVHWDRIVDTNLRGAFLVTRCAAGPMLARGRGAVVNLCSLTSFVGVPTAAPYGASKSGLLGLTRTLAAEWAGQGVRVNAIAPGYFRTAMTDEFYRAEGWQEKMLDRIPMGRFGEGRDLAGAVLFLVSDASAYVTGQCIGIDGGYLASI